MATTETAKPTKSRKTKKKKPSAANAKPNTWQSVTSILDCGKKSPYLWSLPAGVASVQIADRLSGWCTVSLQKSAYSPEAIEDFRSWADSDQEPHALEALHCLQALWLVAKLAEKGETELADKIVARATTLVERATATQIDSVWSQFLCEIELPLVLLAVGKTDLTPKPSAKQLTSRLAELLDDVCDTDGVPHARHLQYLRPTLASWIRAVTFGNRQGIDLLKKKSQKQYDALFEQCLRFSTFDRGSLGCDHGDYDFSKRMFQLGLELSDDPDAAALASGALGLGRKQTVSTLDGLISAATHSEWGSIALLRSHWTRTSPKLLVDYDGQGIHCHLDTIKSLLRGTWEIRIDRDGKQLTPTDEWILVCWHDDDDCVYLELEREYSQGTKVQRQILLGIEDSVLFSGDAVFFDEPCEWDYRSSLPLAPGIELIGAEESRESHLVHHEGNGATTTLGLVVPLALPEWRQEPVDAGLQQDDHAMTLYAHRSSARGYFPIFMDLNPVRAQNALTWRRLTVGENLAICPDDVAVAYRVQVGQEQWIFYRALSGTANRTFLGQNVFADFFAGQFDADGQVNEFISINEEDD